MERKNPVRVSIPVSVAAEIGNFKKAIGGVLDKLGCQACCSGHDILFDLQRNFAFDGQLKISGFAPNNAIHKTAKSPIITASLSPEKSNDINGVFESIDKIADLLGCPACCSGHDLYLNTEQNFIIDEKINIRDLSFSVA